MVTKVIYFDEETMAELCCRMAEGLMLTKRPADTSAIEAWSAMPEFTRERIESAAGKAVDYFIEILNREGVGGPMTLQ